MRTFVAGLAAVVLAGCSTPPTPLADVATFQIVTAYDVVPGRGPVGVTDRFGLNGKMVAFVSVFWPDDRPIGGIQSFESRWYSGDRLVIKRQTEFNIGRAPYHFWSNALPVDLGVGPGHYEVWGNGRKLGEKSFEISRPGAPAGTRPALPA